MSGRPLRVVEVCLSDGRGGLERYAAKVVTGLLERGHQVSVVARPSSTFLRLSGRNPAVVIKPVRYVPWRGVYNLRRLVGTADVIHIHRSADLPVAALAARFSVARPALVYSRHMSITRNRRWSLSHRWMMAQVSQVLVVSSRLKADAQAMWPIDNKKIELLYPGVDVGNLPEQTCWDRPDELGFLVGCFSRIEPAKGQGLLLRSIAHLCESGIDVGLVIAGAAMDRSYEQHLRRLAVNAGIGQRVFFIGEIDNVRSVMSLCDVVVMPSEAETLGLVLIEAQLAGVAVVGSDAGGVRDIVEPGQTGLLFPTGRVDALAEAIHKLWRYPDYRQSLAHAGQIAARKKFDMQSHLGQLESFFYALVGP